MSRGFGFWEIEANSQLPPLVECRGTGARLLSSTFPSSCPLSFLRFAGYFDVPNLIEGIRRTDLLTSSLLIAVLFDVAAGERPTKNVQPLGRGTLSLSPISCRLKWPVIEPIHCPIADPLTSLCTYLGNRFFKVGLWGSKVYFGRKRGRYRYLW